MTENCTKYTMLKVELDTVENELKTHTDMSYELYSHLKEKQRILKEKIKECPLLYEIWYHFYDGSMAGFNNYDECVERYVDSDKAYERLEELNSEDRERPYSIKVVELDG